MEMDSRQLCDDLLALLGRLKQAMSKAAEEYHLTMQQLYALYAIFEGESTMGHLASALHCDASNVTGIVDRLVDRELITSSPSTQDRRTKVLALKDTGEQIVTEFMYELPRYFGSTRITQKECTQLHNLIAKITSGNE